MATFHQHPKVTDKDVCMWCGDAFGAELSTDSRSRHRNACRDKAKLCLQVTSVMLLSFFYNRHNVTGPLDVSVYDQPSDHILVCATEHPRV
jgi:hypothetical protein